MKAPPTDPDRLSARKISGGARSAADSDQRTVLAPVLSTAQLQGDDPDALLQRLLLTPP